MEGRSRNRGVAVGLSCVLALFVGGRAAGQGRTRPSASPSGGEALHPQGQAELTRASLLTAILEFPGPDPNDLTTEGEEHPDDEASTRIEPGTLLAPLKAASGINGTPSPAPVVGWKAMDAMGGVAADAQVAASTTHVIVTNRTTIGFYNKAGTNPCDPNKVTPCLVSALSMFKPLGLNTNAFQPEPIDQYFDVRALFDPIRHRFFIVGLGKYSKFRQVLPAQRRMVTAVAVSKSENPIDGWYLYWWDAVSHWGNDDNVFDWGDVADYPTIGMDATLFHETHKVFNVDLAGANTFRYYRVNFHDADAMAAGMPANQVKGWVYWDLKNQDGTAAKQIVAVKHHSPGPFRFYVARQGDDRLTIWGLSNPLQPNQQIIAASITAQSWQEPTSVPQKNDGSSIDNYIKMTNLGTSPLTAAFRNDRLYITTNDALGVFDTVRLVRVWTGVFPALFADAPHKFLDRDFGTFDTTEDSPVGMAGWGGVEVNKDDTAAVVFARVSTAFYNEVRYSAHVGDEPDMRLSRLLKAGEFPYVDAVTNKAGDDDMNKPQPWGDTAGAAVDPKDDTGIWLAQQYAAKIPQFPNYSIWVSKVLGPVYFDLLFTDGRVSSADRIGGGLAVFGVLHNGGDGDSPAGEVRVSLADATGRPGGTPLATIPIATIRSGRSLTIDTVIQLPPGTKPGPHQLRLEVRTPQSRDEYNTDNNEWFLPFVVQSTVPQ